MKKKVLLLFWTILCISHYAVASNNDVRHKYNFNSDWLLSVGDANGAEQQKYTDNSWKKVTLPHAFNEDEAFRYSIDELTDTIVWYRKHFRLPAGSEGKKYL